LFGWYFVEQATRLPHNLISLKTFTTKRQCFRRSEIVA